MANSMPSPASLANLRDLHLPPAVSSWPPAVGWWLIAGLMLIGLVGGTVWLLLTWERRALRRAALRALSDIQVNMLTQDEQTVATQCASVLRRLALAYFPRGQVASLHGDSWQRFLSQHSRDTQLHAQFLILARAPYDPTVIVNKRDLHAACVRWVSQLPLTRQGDQRV